MTKVENRILYVEGRALVGHGLICVERVQDIDASTLGVRTYLGVGPIHD